MPDNKQLTIDGKAPVSPNNPFTHIECGIGTISYTVDSLALEELMETLGTAIANSNHNHVIAVLSKIKK